MSVTTVHAAQGVRLTAFGLSVLAAVASLLVLAAALWAHAADASTSVWVSLALLAVVIRPAAIFYHRRHPLS